MNTALFLMILLGFLYALLSGDAGEISGAIMQAGQTAAETMIKLMGGFMLFGGITRVLEEAGAVRSLVCLLRRPLRRIFGQEISDDALGAAALNLSANMLGMGNAATPMGLKAAALMNPGRAESAPFGLCMLLVINATSVQLFPTTVISLRYAAGSANPGAIIWPTLAASSVATAVGMAVCCLCERRAGG